MRRILLIFGIDLRPVARMQRKSGKAFSLFNKTLKRLDKLNAQIEQHKSDHKAMLEAIQANHDTLHAQLEKNTRLKDKLADFVA